MGRMQVKRAYKYRFYPTEQQRQELLRTFGCVRKVYNLALDARTRAWFTEQRRVNYTETSKLLTEWKRSDEFSYLGEVSSVPLQQTLRHLQTAFTNFFDKRAKYPTFKSRKMSRQSAEYTRSAFTFGDGRLRLAKMHDPLNIVWSRPLPDGAEPSTVTVSRDAADRWFVSILVETSTDHHEPTDNTVGVDVGVDSLATLSTGEKVTNPKHERRDRRRLAKAQRELARKQKGSNNRAKARRDVARVYARITDRRRDHLHKVTTRLVRDNQTVVLEDLQVRTMLRNGKLARAVSDAAWAQFRTMLEYKAAWYGREAIAVDRWFPSSKTCSACGGLAESMPLHIRTWICNGCGTTHDRDVNAAQNIKAAGLAVSAWGAGVRPQRESSRTGQPARKQEPSGASRKEIPALRGGE
ncbi:putative transposase [Actinopolyspora biskrensis]|uniref:Putative transposase n=1 Tax=Actinopolyspora biskrensis TaxID=1470178 RepID=A0A852Z4Z1_9ACTN|nr:RNA-guided endonuclease TnpB family protein [Actinopolyspora biskrensis]NYH77447.1 putative transposase [Actinopolyspora biskrensis]